MSAETLLFEAIFAQAYDKNVKNTCLEIKPDYFVSKHHKELAQACMDVVATGSPPTRDIVLATFDWNETSRQAIEGMDLETGQYCDLGLALKTVKKDWLTRRIKAEAERAIESEGDPITMGSDLIGRISNLIVDADEGKLKVKSLRESMEELQAGNPLLSPELAKNKVVTKIFPIDSVVRMGAGRLGIIAAMPSAGKTSMAIQIAQQTGRRGGRGLIVSLEMQEAEINSRRIANWTGRDSWKILQNTKQMWFDQAHLDAADNCLNITCGAGQDWFSLDAKIRSVHAATPLDYVIVDYFTLLEPPEKRKGENNAASYGHISKGAKMLAKDLQCCVILVSQFNRETDEYFEPKLKQLKETSQLEQDADFALLMWNLKQDAPTPGERTIACRIAKNRGGKRGDLVTMWFNPTTCRFVSAHTGEPRLQAA